MPGICSSVSRAVLSCRTCAISSTSAFTLRFSAPICHTHTRCLSNRKRQRCRAQPWFGSMAKVAKSERGCQQPPSCCGVPAEQRCSVAGSAPPVPCPVPQGSPPPALCTAGFGLQPPAAASTLTLRQIWARKSAADALPQLNERQPNLEALLQRLQLPLPRRCRRLKLASLPLCLLLPRSALLLQRPKSSLQVLHLHPQPYRCQFYPSIPACNRHPSRIP